MQGMEDALELIGDLFVSGELADELRKGEFSFKPTIALMIEATPVENGIGTVMIEYFQLLAQLRWHSQCYCTVKYSIFATDEQLSVC